MTNNLMGPRPVHVEEHFWITLPDGCRLAARLWLPEGAATEPVPAILEYIPYRKRDGSIERDEGMFPYLASHGYACIRVDIRGNGESDGLMEDEYTAQELDDGVEVIKWLATQDWCSGAVGIIGISWGGFNGLQIAALQPEALKAVITICSTDDRYADDIHYMGGCLLNDNLSWSSQMLAYSSRPPDPALVGEDWRNIWLYRLENMPLLAANWLRHQRRDAFWEHGSVCEDYSRIKAPVYAVGGWADGYTNAIPRLLNNLDVPAEGLIGPWVHKYPHLAWPAPAIDFLPDMKRWWDRWLKGDESAATESTLRAYVMESVPPAADYAERPGRWVARDSAAPDETRRLYLGPAGLHDQPGEAAELSVSSPQHTGLAGGRWCAGMRLDMEHPTDQRGDDAYSLTFDSAPLEEDLVLLGAPEVELEIAVDRPQAQIAVRLCDLRPDGSSARITYGLLNLSHRDGHAQPQPLEPGKRYRVKVKLNDIGYRLPAGHRLRLALSTAYWPIAWPSPECVTATLSTTASHLTLPVLSGDLGESPRFDPPIERSRAQTETRRPSTSSRVVEQDIASGLVTVRTVEDFGEKTLLGNGLEIGSKVEERFVIHPDDPLSAWAEARWTMQVGRGAWQTETHGHTTMRADATTFYLEARLEAFENGERLFEKSWAEAIPRDHL